MGSLLMQWAYVSTYYGMSAIALKYSPSAQLKTWVESHPAFFEHVRIQFAGPGDAVPGRVFFSPDCDILANDTIAHTFCSGKGSAYCAHSLINMNTPEGPYNASPEVDTDWFAFDTPDEVSLYYRQNCFR